MFNKVWLAWIGNACAIGQFAAALSWRFITMTRTDMVLDTVLHGRQGTAMPPWGEQMNDDQIAAVINYVLSAWGNDFGAVTPEDVATKR